MARLLDRVDPQRDTVLMVALQPAQRPQPDRGRAAGPRAGARLPPLGLHPAVGFLTLVDVAPTLLDQLGVARPVDMEGRPAEVVASNASSNTGSTGWWH